MTGRLDYDIIGEGYAAVRRPDPRIAAAIERAPGDARTVVDVGAGTGAYEPRREVVAVEPSAVMIRQRAPGAAPVVRARAEQLPFEDSSFDAAMAVLCVHHWRDPGRGIAEMRRVARRVVVMTWEQDVVDRFWLVRDYIPAMSAYDRDRHVGVAARRTMLGPGARVVPVLVPWDCTDGFLGAYWRRPEMYLDSAVRAGISSFVALGPTCEPGLARLAEDLASGRWRQRNAALLTRAELDVGYRLILSEAAAGAA